MKIKDALKVNVYSPMTEGTVDVGIYLSKIVKAEFIDEPPKPYLEIYQDLYNYDNEYYVLIRYYQKSASSREFYKKMLSYGIKNIEELEGIKEKVLVSIPDRKSKYLEISDRVQYVEPEETENTDNKDD